MKYVLMLASTFLATPAFSADGSLLDQIIARGYVTVGTGSTNAPFHFLDEKGELVGMDAAMGHIIAKGLFGDASKVKFVDQSADSRIANLLTGNVDITCQFMTVTAQRALQVEFTVPYYREGVGILLSAKGKYKNFDEIKAAGKSVTVSMLQNNFAEEWTHKALPDATVEQYESQDLTIQALNSGRVDGAIVDASNVRWLLQHESGRYLDAGYYWQPNNYSCAVKKGDQVFLNWVNTTIEQAVTGVDFDDYAAAYKTFFGVELSPPAIGRP